MALTTADRSWFEREALALLPDLYSTAMRLTREPADAEDLVADCVAKAWGGFPRLEERDSFRGWLFRILMNTFISQRRSRAARPREESLPEDGEEPASFSLFEQLHQPFLLWWSNPEQDFLNRLLQEDLERAVEALPDSYRMVVLLADLQGFTYAEISEALQIPVGTVRSRLSRGRGMLQRALWEHARDAGLVVEPARPKPNTPQ